MGEGLDKRNAPQPELGGVNYFTGRTWLGPMAVIRRLRRSRLEAIVDHRPMPLLVGARLIARRR